MWNEQNEPYADLPVYAFAGETYTGYHGTTDENGQVVLTLPIGNYHFRTDYDGVHFWSSAENDCAIPGCESAIVTIPGGYRYEEVTINYDYDLLYRLTEANYSNDDYYHYVYDAVGNMLSQESMVDDQSSLTSYQYDDANRIFFENSDGTMIYYSWDNNGNLIYNGRYANTYDAANRLITRVKFAPFGVTFYNYNGLNDRLREAVNGGGTTTFTMDLNMGLTQSLSDGTNTYIYGLDRLAQSGTETEYFLGDGLGSVRQMTDAGGAVTFAQSYNPYGVVTSTAGTSQTSYGFTNEYTSQGLVYLRARYYAPGMGRFLTKDTWGGDYNRPLSLNRWMYVEGNPINYTDPTGNISCNSSEDPVCIQKVYQLKDYGANTIKPRVQKGELPPVEGFAQFADYAMALFDNDIRGAMWAMTNTIDGMDANKGPIWPQAINLLGKQGYVYWLGENWLPYNHIEDNNLYYWDGQNEMSIWVHSRRGDWRKEYWDGTANQAFHFWYYVAVTFFDGTPYARFANWYHEGTQNYSDVSFVTDHNAPAYSGRTQEDWDLSLAGMRLGNILRTDDLIYKYINSGFCNPTTYPNLFAHLYTNPGSWIRTNLKDPAFNSIKYRRPQ